MSGITHLLSSKFDIDLKDYFKLSEEDKQTITDVIVSFHKDNLKREPKLIWFYLDLLREDIRVAEQRNEFERADMMYRTQKKLEKDFQKYKYYRKDT